MLGNSIAKFFKVDSLISNFTGFVETRIELLKIEAKEELSKGLSSVIVYLLLIFVFAVSVVFVSVAMALWIGTLVGMAGGFAMVSALYLIIGFFLLAKREKLTKTFEIKIDQMLKKKNG